MATLASKFLIGDDPKFRWEDRGAVYGVGVLSPDGAPPGEPFVAIVQHLLTGILIADHPVLTGHPFMALPVMEDELAPAIVIYTDGDPLLLNRDGVQSGPEVEALCKSPGDIRSLFATDSDKPEREDIITEAIHLLDDDLSPAGVIDNNGLKIFHRSTSSPGMYWRDGLLGVRSENPGANTIQLRSTTPAGTVAPGVYILENGRKVCSFTANGIETFAGEAGKGDYESADAVDAAGGRQEKPGSVENAATTDELQNWDIQDASIEGAERAPLYDTHFGVPSVSRRHSTFDRRDGFVVRMSSGFVQFTENAIVIRIGRRVMAIRPRVINFIDAQTSRIISRLDREGFRRMSEE